MKTCVARVSISGDLRERLDAVSKAGFDGIETSGWISLPLRNDLPD